MQNLYNMKVKAEIIIIHKTKVFNILRNVTGGIFSFIGFYMIISRNFASGIFMMLAGIALLPAFYKKSRLNKLKHIQIILPLVPIIISIIFIPKNTNNNDVIETNAVTVTHEEEKIEITSLYFKE